MEILAPLMLLIALIGLVMAAITVLTWDTPKWVLYTLLSSLLIMITTSAAYLIYKIVIGFQAVLT